MTTQTNRKSGASWNKVVGATLLALLLGMLLGLWLMARRIFPAPPLAAGSAYFYATVALLPALIVFLLMLRARPVGSRLALLTLPFFGGLIFVIYLALIGPALYSDIQCQAAGLGPSDRQQCSCQIDSGEGPSVVACSATSLSPLPLIRLDGE